jgi:4-hydroxybenzoate polyprenyltransferase
MKTPDKTSLRADLNSRRLKVRSRNIVVDLDGTLVMTDTLLESFFLFLKSQPHRLLILFIYLFRGKAAFKNFLAISTYGLINFKTLPYHPALLSWLHTQKKKGAKIYLATAAHIDIAKGIVSHLKLFDGFFATQTTNLIGSVKRDCLIKAFGKGGYEYIGNAKNDIPVWQAASEIYLSNPEFGVLAAAHKIAKPKFVFENRDSYFFNLFKLLRSHQWAKNTLIFLPLLAAHRFYELNLLFNSIVAFVTFGLCASSAYIINDLLDLQDDRLHKTKYKRPLASGHFSILHAFLLIPSILSASFFLAVLFLPIFFSLVLFIYLLLTVTYSFYFKRLAIFDVMLLAFLYLLRVIAGAKATDIDTTFWMLLFCMFTFLSLAFLKRYAELYSQINKDQSSKILGRGYYRSDFELLASLGGASGFISVLVLALYINDPLSANLYKHPEWMWLACPLLVLWMSRSWLLAHRGEMHDDPVIFALKDKVSQSITILFILSFVLASI